MGMLGNGKRKINELEQWISYWKEMNINAVYLGPVFHSKVHGYDTIDYYRVDERLGNNEMLKSFIKACHYEGIDVILDCVFNHVSRDFFAFQDVLNKKQTSDYVQWFYLDFSKNNIRNDGFSYGDWAGHHDLVKLNVANPKVKNYLMKILQFWMEEFDIDGLRFDAADVIERNFLEELIHYAKQTKPDFYSVGEMVHGDYRKFLRESSLDSVTNYEIYKGMYSSLNDHNYFEIAYSMKRLFSKDGVLKEGAQYNFVDNHDVHRAASVLNKEAHLYPLYIMLYTMKGYTSLYYGSEFGMEGKRTDTSDYELRKELLWEEVQRDKEHPLRKLIMQLSMIRKEHDFFAFGEYEEILVEHEFIIYRRFNTKKNALIFLNQADTERRISFQMMKDLCDKFGLKGYDRLNHEELLEKSKEVIIYPHWGRLLID